MIEILNGMHETIRYKEFAGFRLYYNEQIENYPTHWHVGIEIIMPLKNQYTVGIQKDRIVLEEHDIIIINTGTIHSLEAPASGERIIIQFDVSLLNILKEFETLLFMMPPTMVFRASEVSEIYRFIRGNLETIIREYDGKKAFNEAFIYAKLIEIYGEIAREQVYNREYAGDKDMVKQQNYIESMLGTFDYINHHYMESLTLDQVAAVSGFSKFHFTRVFKQFTNMTFYEYLNQKRIKQATILLSNQEMSITEVAMSSGFNSISTFNRTFKELIGRSPSSYRNKRKELHQKENIRGGG